MSDDQQPPGDQPPIFVPPGGAPAGPPVPPPAGVPMPPTPPVGPPPVGAPTPPAPFPYGTPYAPAPPPMPYVPPPPPRLAGPAGWSWTVGLIALAGGWLAAQVAIAILLVVFFGADQKAIDDPVFVVTASILQGVIFVIASVAVVRSRGPVSARDFGLLRAPFAPAAGKAAAVFVGYLVALGIYSQLVHLTADDTPEKLGADSGELGMIAFVLMASIIAPFAEEFLFRGVVFRAFANGIGVVAAALVSGLLFGALHISELSNERLLQVIPLAVLGVFLALLYAWSGTLFAPIAVHATNNAFAVAYYAADHGSMLGVVLAPIAWLAMIALCVFGGRLTDPPKPDPFAPPVD